MRCFQFIVCLVATIGISITYAQVCPLLAPGGECVPVNQDCAPGKAISRIFNCYSPSMKCCYTPTGPPPPPPQSTCGERSNIGRIFGGLPAGSACRWPWMVSIRVRKSGSTGLLSMRNTNNACGGVLITPSVVLTSAFCLQFASLTNGRQPAAGNLLVVGGEYNASDISFNSNFELQESFHTVTSAVIHPMNFQSDETNINGAHLVDEMLSQMREGYNFGLLTLEYDVVLGDCRELACLPPPAELQSCNNHVKKCYVASWGTYSGNPDASLILREAPVDLYPAWVCSLINLSGTAPGTSCGRFSEPGFGMCQGDDGGMVICKDPTTGKFTLEGLVNFPHYGICSPSGDNLLSFTDMRNKALMDFIKARI